MSVLHKLRYTPGASVLSCKRLETLFYELLLIDGIVFSLSTCA